MISTNTIKFSSGEIVVTANAMSKLSAQEIARGLSRHLFGDWGEVCDDDWESNDEALQNGNRLHSVYSTSEGVTFWIITECDRSVTTILLPEDY